MALLGFSINNLSLFGLVLAVRIVVDDAIVVVENVERHLSEGERAREATLVTMRETGGALVAIALVLGAVFVPAAFVPGISGQFFQQFGVTIAVATAISLFNSFTLSPALASLMLRHAGPGGAVTSRMALLLSFGSRAAAWFNDAFAGLARLYGALVRRLVARAPLMLAVYALLLAATGYLLVTTPRGFIPAQDRGYLIVIRNFPTALRWSAPRRSRGRPGGSR